MCVCVSGAVMMRMMWMTGRRRILIVFMISIYFSIPLSLYNYNKLTYLPSGSIEQEKIDKHRRRMRHFNRDKSNLGTLSLHDVPIYFVRILCDDNLYMLC